MKTQTKQNILKLIKEKGEISAKEIIIKIGFSKQIIFRHLKSLIEDNLIKKTGTPPKVFYSLKKAVKSEKKINYPTRTIEIIEREFITMTPDGKILKGLKGFEYWCKRRDQKFEKTAEEYIKTIEKYNKFKKNGLINGLQKMQNTFEETYLDQVHYIDFYSIERFGKTKLGNLLLYAKQGQNRGLMQNIADITRPIINKLIKEKRVDSVGFVPPTIGRIVQFQTEFERILSLPLPTIKLVKIKNEIPVAQKTLNKLSDRIENAKNTIFVTEKRRYNTILLIDDAIGSGSTLNEIAKKLKDKGIAKKVISLALVGSYKGFDVINEV